MKGGNDPQFFGTGQNAPVGRAASAGWAKCTVSQARLQSCDRTTLERGLSPGST
jgi:hypothetical protein